MERGKVVVDDYYRTNVEGVYAIGDIVHGPALAHVASQEAHICVEKIAGHQPEPIDYGNIPGCTYTTPEVASVGLNEQKALEAGYEIKVGRFPFTASGKATAAGNRDGQNRPATWLPSYWRQCDRDDYRSCCGTQVAYDRDAAAELRTSASDHV